MQKIIDKKRVTALWDIGLGPAEIAERIGEKRKSVCSLLHRLGLKREKTTLPVDEARLKELWLAGASQGEIAEALGTTRGVVSGKIDRMGLQRGIGFFNPKGKTQDYSARKAAVRYVEPKPEPVPVVRKPAKISRVEMLAKGGWSNDRPSRVPVRELSKSELREQLRQAFANTGTR